MTTYTVRGHPELDDITEYDKDKLTKVIEKYNEWYTRHNHESDRKKPSQAAWAYAMYDIKDYINENMIDELSTLEETQVVEGNGYSSFPVSSIFSKIDTIREELLEKTVHPTLLEMEPALLMDILNKLKMCTRYVIQNTSIQRLHQKSWVHADTLRDLGGAHALITTDDAVLPASVKTSHPEADIGTLLHRIKQFRV
jgi:hypothetical protein